MNNWQIINKTKCQLKQISWGQIVLHIFSLWHLLVLNDFLFFSLMYFGVEYDFHYNWNRTHFWLGASCRTPPGAGFSRCFQLFWSCCCLFNTCPISILNFIYNICGHLVMLSVMKNNHDIIVTEYPGRIHNTFYLKLPTLQSEIIGETSVNTIWSDWTITSWFSSNTIKGLVVVCKISENIGWFKKIIFYITYQEIRKSLDFSSV